MNTAGIREGDIVRIDVRGNRSWAEVVRPAYKDEGLAKRVLEVKPLSGQWVNTRIPSRFVTPREVIEHYARRGRRNGTE